MSVGIFGIGVFAPMVMVLPWEVKISILYGLLLL